jgi:Flp pilus assembly protein TadD
MLLRLSLLATVALAMPLAAQDTDESALEALDKQPAPAFKPPEAPGSAELRDAVRRMAQRPTDPLALTDAGYASLKLGDAQAALNFFTRANGIQPGNSRIIAGLGAAYVRTENPFEALRYFDDAVKLGANERSIALDRALAFDLLGNFERAQQDYKLARSFWDNDEAVRRQAMSLSMAGKANEADAMLVPLLQKNDPEAWRARALMLASRGETREAMQITQGFLSADSARRFEPYLRQMVRLTDAQKAAAFHFGHFPVGRIGEDSAEIRQIAANSPSPKPAGSAGGQDRLIPSGEPLGAKGRKTAAVKRDTEKVVKPGKKGGRETAAPGFSTETAQAKVAEASKSKPVVLATGSLPPPDTARAPVKLVLPPIERPNAVVPAPSAATAAAASLPPAAPKVVASSAYDQTIARQAQAQAPAPPPAMAPEGKPPQEPAEVAANVQPTKVAVAQPVQITTPPQTQAKTGSSSDPQGPLPDGRIVGEQAVIVTTAENVGAPAQVAQPAPAVEQPPIVPTQSPPKSFDLAAVVESIEIPKSEQERAVAPVDLTKIKPAQPKPENAVDPKTAKAKVESKAPLQPARIWVQVATGAEAALGGDYRRFAKKSPELFKGKEGWTSVWGKSSRLLVGPFANAQAAKKWDADYRKAGGSSFVWNSENGTIVKKLGAK